jgi:hypothetical protein
MANGFPPPAPRIPVPQWRNLLSFAPAVFVCPPRRAEWFFCPSELSRSLVMLVETCHYPITCVPHLRYEMYIFSTDIAYLRHARKKNLSIFYQHIVPTEHFVSYKGYDGQQIMNVNFKNCTLIFDTQPSRMMLVEPGRRMPLRIYLFLESLLYNWFPPKKIN